MSGPILHLNAERAILFLEELDDVRISGTSLSVVIDDSRGLSRDFIAHLLRMHPDCHLSGPALADLVAPAISKPAPFPLAWAAMGVLVICVAVLGVYNLAIDFAYWMPLSHA